MSHNCGNCDWGFPTCRICDEESYVCCGYPFYNFPQKLKTYRCNAWTHSASVGAAPFWCEPYTKRRLTDEEMAANQTPDAVRKRIAAMENNGTFKRQAAEHIRKNGAPESTPKSNKRELWQLVLAGEIYPQAAKDISDAMAPYAF